MLSITSLVCLLATGPNWNTADLTVDRLLSEGKNRSHAYATLNHFTSKFGPRLTGSPNLYRAQLWAEAEFKKLGLTNVQLEKWGDVPVGFYRGKNQVFRMTAPWKTEFVFTTPAWTPGTKGSIKIQPILEPETMEEFKAIESKLAGAWVVMRRSSGLRGAQGEASEVEKAILAAPIAGKIFGTADERVHTGGRFTGLSMESLPKVVEVRIRKSDYKTLTTALKVGRNVELEANIENHFVPGPVPQYNVIAELKGSEKPDEVVIICGHYDSWNGPGSVGANDNGTGSTVTLEAARLLSRVGAKPKRTIRFILWSGEEQGLLGSRAYVEMHKGEMDKISAVFNDDGGTNYQGGYVCLDTMAPMLKASMEPVEKAFPELPMKLDVVKEMPRGGSSDHASFNFVGVPGFFSIESGKADYGFVWHTQNDRPENSIPEYLAQSSTNAAVVAYNVANAPTLLPRAPKPAAGVGGLVFKPQGGTRNYYHDHSHDDGHDHDDDYVAYLVDTILRRFGFIK